ncbi:GyrI-like domain-containing protein [Herbaspirillum sp. NPDC101397]|uniref:AraC family transcriptional regulator n=1 Tax=Herbaspirillum sp. NPDC101397 TaxID=3364006 RepID=UPI00383A2AE6
MKPDRSEKNYRSRMARVVAAIAADPIAPHRLEKLAALAHFSPFHFHRLYRSLIGETVADTVRRVRLAHAATLLAEIRRSVTDIGLEAGYESPQAFTRAFRQYAGLSPREFQKKIHVIADKERAAGERSVSAGPQVQLIEQGAMRVQALRHHGPLGTIPHTHRHLHQLVGPRPFRQWLGIAHGDPDAGDDFSYFAAAELIEEPLISTDVELIDIPAGCYASHALIGPYTQINATISALYSLWLPYSGYEPDDRPLLEVYRNSPRDTAPEQLHTDLLIPVRPIDPFAD